MYYIYYFFLLMVFSEKPKNENKESVYINYELPVDTQPPPLPGKYDVAVMFYICFCYIFQLKNYIINKIKSKI